MDDSILQKLQPIFHEVFDDDNIHVIPETTANDIEGWDSFSHIRLVLAIEQAFSLKFSAREISKLKNVGEFVELIQSKA